LNGGRSLPDFAENGLFDAGLPAAGLRSNGLPAGLPAKVRPAAGFDS
jgi:hypothetical protein